jgi:3-hydroxyacyl-CoA dehydrogenase
MSDAIKKVALIGGGVIGGGWAARFLLNGVDVNIYDLSKNYKKNLEKMLSNAKLAYSKLTMAPLLMPGELKFCRSIESAVKNVEFVQESVPEKLELKCSILNEIEKYSHKNALICSSTSGIKPTSLQIEMEHPERLMVGHPFNPVYLLPLVEICGGKKTLKENINKAAEFFREVGMKPLIIRKEIDAFIADRLQEAVWREALWLIKDKIQLQRN